MFHGASHVVAVICCMAATIVIAALSFRFVETPFLRLKSRFENARALNGTVPAATQGAPVVAIPSANH
jgi:peptidoglycan/LPS O-acetylase OafA/YrhL